MMGMEEGPLIFKHFLDVYDGDGGGGRRPDALSRRKHGFDSRWARQQDQ
jgi:hypothetical protein